MKTNLEKYKKDLDRLLEYGEKIRVGYLYEVDNEAGREKLEGKQKLAFNMKNYESWYTESLEVIRQIIPERLDDFKKLYKDEKHKATDFATYTISDALIKLEIKQKVDNSGWYEEETIIANRKSGFPKFQQQFSILSSAKQRFESSLFDIKQLVQADLFDSELDAARELNKKGFTRGAGAIAGVVLEGHLSKVCGKNGIRITKKDLTINDFNQPLKDNDVIEISTWRFIQHLADLRNLCDHNKKREPKKEEIDGLINGVEKITKTIF